MTEDLKLFVWEHVLTDYTDGIMFALAHDVDEARQLIMKAQEYESSCVKQELSSEPKIVTTPKGWVLCGGG